MVYKVYRLSSRVELVLQLTRSINTMRTLTKRQVLSMFSEVWRDTVAAYPNWRGDSVAKREAFNNYVDALNKDRKVSDAQAFSWSNPF